QERKRGPPFLRNERDGVPAKLTCTIWRCRKSSLSAVTGHSELAPDSFKVDRDANFATRGLWLSTYNCRPVVPALNGVNSLFVDGVRIGKFRPREAQRSEERRVGNECRAR